MLALLLSIAMVAGAFADEQGNRKQPKSLDDALLEDLDAGLAKPPRAGKPAAKDEKQTRDAGESQPAKRSAGRSLDDALLEGLEGEDVGTGAANENPLVRLSRRMRQVERRIAETRGDETTQRLEKDIADDLSKLVDQLERQCRQNKKPSPGPRRQQTSSAKPAARPSEEPGDKPARDSAPLTKSRETAKVEGVKVQEMLKDVWGHLPPHLRQRMEQSANEEFLPKYETEISEYYRSLVGGKKERK